MPLIERTSVWSQPFPAVGTPSGLEDIVIPIDVSPNCDDCDAVSYLPHILCPGEEDWCCLTSGTGEDGLARNVCGDLPYCQPVESGQCLDFQFQFQNTRNSRRPISWANWLATTQTIQYGWYHPVSNPTNWTIRMRIIDGNGNEVPNPHTYIQQASVYLVRDDNASTGFPTQAWYRWVQQIRICLPSMGTFSTDNFYVEFEVLPFNWISGSGAKYRSEQYCYQECGDDCDKPLTTIEGVWNEFDCWGQYYGAVKPQASFRRYNGSEIPPRLLWAITMFGQVVSQYRHIVVIPAEFRKDGYEINKDIPDRLCSATSTTSMANYQLRGNKMIPPYVAELLKNALAAHTTIVNNSIEVNATGLSRNDAVGSMFDIDENMSGCPCVIDLSCN